MSWRTRVLWGICIVWAGCITFFYARAFINSNTFEEQLAGECPELHIAVFPREILVHTIARKEWVELIAWHDKKTGEELFTSTKAYRQYKATASCLDHKVRAFLLLEKAKAGMIEPVLRVKYGYFFMVALFPAALVWIALRVSAWRQLRTNQI